VLEFQAAIGEWTVSIVEVLVDRAGEDELVEGYLLACFAVINIQHDLDVRMIEHVAEHVSVAARRHRLVAIREIAIVAIETDRHARGNLSVELRGIKAHCFRV
jgi:hypothetical protein